MIGQSGFRGLPLVVKNLLIINILFFLGTFGLEKVGIDLYEHFSLFYPSSEYFRPFQFVTHMFMHGGLMHIFFNMFALWMFGSVIESVWGPKRFLIYFFVTGLGAAALHTFVNYLTMSSMMDAFATYQNTPSPETFQSFISEYYPEYRRAVADFITNWSIDPDNPNYLTETMQFIQGKIDQKINIPTVGASGAVFGILLAFGMLFPNAQLMLLFPPIPIKAKWFVIIYGAIELFAGVMSQPGDNIAHFAHLGGMLFGFIFIKIWDKHQFTRLR